MDILTNGPCKPLRVLPGDWSCKDCGIYVRLDHKNCPHCREKKLFAETKQPTWSPA